MGVGLVVKCGCWVEDVTKIRVVQGVCMNRQRQYRNYGKKWIFSTKHKKGEKKERRNINIENIKRYANKTKKASSVNTFLHQPQT